MGHILAFSRQSEHELMPVELSPIVREVARFMRASLPASIDIRQKIAGTPMVMADPTQIHQVMMNLCTNAGQAMSGREGRWPSSWSPWGSMPNSPTGTRG